MASTGGLADMPLAGDDLLALAVQMGFKAVASAPFVRSSFNALGLFEQVRRT